MTTPKSSPTHVAWCWNCEIVLPFRQKSERAKWIVRHRAETCHGRHVIVTSTR